MSQAKTAATTTLPVTRAVSSRRSLFGGAAAVAIGSVITSGVAAGIAASVGDLLPAEPTPIMAAATRLSQLSALDEDDMTGEQFDAVTREQLELQYLITDTAPQSVSDRVVLLMVAAAEIARKALEDDGSFSHEHGEVIVRRVMHFLSDREGLNLNEVGGTFLLPWEKQEVLALTGTVAEASLRFNKIDQARALNRHDEERAMAERQIIRARYRLPSEQERIERLVKEASKKWANISDNDPRFDTGRAMLERAGVTLAGQR